jgi:hypothetical protein
MFVQKWGRGGIQRTAQHFKAGMRERCPGIMSFGVRNYYSGKVLLCALTLSEHQRKKFATGVRPGSEEK